MSKTKNKAIRLIAAMLAAIVALCAGISAAAETKYLPDVSDEMTRAEYWAEKAEQPDAVMAGADEIAALNAAFLECPDCTMTDLTRFYPSYDGEALKRSLLKLAMKDLSDYLDAGYFNTDEQPVPYADMAAIFESIDGAETIPTQRVRYGTYAVPVIQHAGNGLRMLLPHQCKKGGRNSMAVVRSGRDGPMGGVPLVESVHLRGKAIEHGCPVDGRCRGHHRALGQGPAAVVHQVMEVGKVFGRGPAHCFCGPAVHANDKNVFCMLHRGVIPATGNAAKGQGHCGGQHNTCNGEGFFHSFVIVIPSNKAIILF